MAEEYQDDNGKMSSVLRGLYKNYKRSGIRLVDLTGRQGTDPFTGAVIQEDMAKGMGQRRAERGGPEPLDPNGERVIDRLFNKGNRTGST